VEQRTSELKEINEELLREILGENQRSVH